MEKGRLSQTMRIDLIPDTPKEPVGTDKQVVIAPHTRKYRRVKLPLEQGPVQNAHYNELLQSLYDAAIISDMKGLIADANVRALEFLQYKRSEIIGLTIFEMISGLDESLLDTLTENLQNERFTLIQAYCLRKDGSFFPAEIAVNELELDEKQLCFFIRDITLRRQAEEMLRTEHNAIQNSGNGIAITDLDGFIEYCNPAVAKMWGHETTDALLGVNMCSVVADSEGCNRIFSTVKDTQQPWVGESVAHRRDEASFVVQLSVAPNRNADGVMIGMVLSLVDVSDRKRAEEAEREAERHRVMLESLGAACHHLGQPATVLLANLGIMNKRIGDKFPDFKDLLQTSIEAAETLGEILHKLNTVNEYKTTRYLDKPDGQDDTSENRILEI